MPTDFEKFLPPQKKIRPYTKSFFLKFSSLQNKFGAEIYGAYGPQGTKLIKQIGKKEFKKLQGKCHVICLSAS